MEEFLTISKESESELIVKKSRFIADIYYVESILEAKKKLEQIKKEHHSAKHYCYAYRILDDGLKERACDDGEPSGTAGAPILALIQGKSLVNVLIVVTRYFGGILLRYTEAW